MKYTIIQFDSHSHSFSGIIEATTYEIKEKLYSLPDLKKEIENKDLIPICEESWEVENNDFFTDDEKIKEAKDRTSYSDLIVANKNNIYFN